MLHIVAQRLGFWDVDLLVDTVPKRKLDRWIAVARMCGWGDEWTMTSTAAVAIHNEIVQLMARAGMKPNNNELFAFDHFEPDIRTGRTPIETKTLSPEQLAAQHKAMAGL